MGRSLRWSREVWWFVVPLAWCPLVALLRPGDPATALARARALVDWQRSWGLAVEPTVHAWVSAVPVLDTLADVFYLVAHLSALIATALWLAVRRPDAFPAFRAVFALAQTATAAIYVLVPVAPVRMLIGDAGAAGPGWTRSVQYELAAMPSGHVVFASIVGLTVWRLAPGAWRWLGPAHVALTVTTVVATAHHLLADGVVAVAVTAAAFATVSIVTPWSFPGRCGAVPAPPIADAGIATGGRG